MVPYFSYPICKSCHHRQKACVWDNKSNNPLAMFLSPAATSAISIPHDHQLALPPIGVYRKQELELLHNWTTNTILTLVPDSPRTRYGFQVLLPQLAFQHDFLLHAMFSISALHMHTFRPSDDFLPLAQVHCQHAILGLRSAGDAVSVDITLMANTILGMYWLASPSWSFLSQDPDIFDWLPATRVFMRSLGAHWAATLNGTRPDSPLIPHDLGDVRKQWRLAPFPSILHNIHRAAVCPFDLHELRDSKTITSYENALQKLSNTWNLFMDPTLQNMAFFLFPSSSDDGFFQYFMEKRPRALIIIAHYCAVLGQFRGTWLYSLERSRSDIQRILSFLDEKWLPWMEYPLKVVAMKEAPFHTDWSGVIGEGARETFQSDSNSTLGDPVQL